MLALQQELVGEVPANPEHDSALGATLNNLAMLLMARGELEEARGFLERAVRAQ